MENNATPQTLTILEQFKINIGDFGPSDANMDQYYNNFINNAIALLLNDDISSDVLDSDLGKATIVLYAEALMNKEDVANNSTITLLKNTLANKTKGDRIEDSDDE